MKRIRMALFGTAAVACLVALFASPAAASSSSSIAGRDFSHTTISAGELAPPSPEGEEYRETSASDAEFGFTGDSSDASLSSQKLAAAPFTGYVKAHTPHRSGGETSGHVSWYLTSGTNQKVTLTSTLKARTSWVTFRTMAGPTSKSVFAGGGSGKDAVARYGCGSWNDRDWYTYGEAFAASPDPFGSHSSAIASVKCEGGLP